MQLPTFAGLDPSGAGIIADIKLSPLSAVSDCRRQLFDFQNTRSAFSARSINGESVRGRSIRFYVMLPSRLENRNAYDREFIEEFALWAEYLGNFVVDPVVRSIRFDLIDDEPYKP